MYNYYYQPSLLSDKNVIHAVFFFLLLLFFIYILNCLCFGFCCAELGEMDLY